jgi:hypothetical protein
MQDAYQGYLSYTGHHPRLEASWALPREAELRARADLWVRRYGANSYDGMDEGRPLAWGDRRVDVLAELGLAFRKPFAPHWSAVADARLAVRRTNYASLVDTYTIDWSYLNWIGWAGVEYRY